jgi:uncharacterized membrane protein YdjX (TVP38/TMEM64 family)
MPSPADSPSLQPATRARAGVPLQRFIPLAIVVAATALVFVTGIYRELSLEALVRHRATIDSLVDAHAMLAVAAYIALYIAAAALSIPGAMILTIIGGLLFGTAVGTAAAITGATIGGTIIFLVARSAIGEWLLRRAGSRASKIMAGFRADAFNYLLFLRLVPLFPFWLVNLVAAFAGVALGPFVAATALGMIPAAAVFAFFGSGLDSALAGKAAAYHACAASGKADCKLDFDFSMVATPHLIAAIAALCVLALAPIVIRRIRANRQRSSQQ